MYIILVRHCIAQCRKIIWVEFWARARPGNLRVSLTPREISPFSHSSFSSPTSSSFSYFFRLLSHGHLNNSHHPREICTPFSHLFPLHNSNHIERLDREPPLLALGAYKFWDRTKLKITFARSFLNQPFHHWKWWDVDPIILRCNELQCQNFPDMIKIIFTQSISFDKLLPIIFKHI